MSSQINGIHHFIKKYIGDSGSFMEIGAFDGETHSNTSFLADNGWTGYYIEPVEEFFNKCVQRHLDNNCRFLQCAVSDSVGEGKIYIGGEISTISHQFKEDIINTGYGKGYYSGETRRVPTMTLEEVFNYFNLPTVDILVIDAEGMEWPILKDFDLGKYLPTMVIIEMHEQSPKWKEYNRDNENINKYFTHYHKIYSDDINTIFVK